MCTYLHLQMCLLHRLLDHGLYHFSVPDSLKLIDRGSRPPVPDITCVKRNRILWFHVIADHQPQCQKVELCRKIVQPVIRRHVKQLPHQSGLFRFHRLIFDNRISDKVIHRNWSMRQCTIWGVLPMILFDQFAVFEHPHSIRICNHPVSAAISARMLSDIHRRTQF